MCQHRFIDSNKCTIWCRIREAVPVWDQRVQGNLYFLLNFAENLNMLFKSLFFKGLPVRIG